MDLRQPKQLHLFLYFYSLFLFFAYGVSRATRQALTSLQVIYNKVQSEVLYQLHLNSGLPLGTPSLREGVLSYFLCIVTLAFHVQLV